MPAKNVTFQTPTPVEDAIVDPVDIYNYLHSSASGKNASIVIDPRLLQVTILSYCGELLFESPPPFSSQSSSVASRNGGGADNLQSAGVTSAVRLQQLENDREKYIEGINTFYSEESLLRERAKEASNLQLMQQSKLRPSTRLTAGSRSMRMSNLNGNTPPHPDVRPSAAGLALQGSGSPASRRQTPATVVEAPQPPKPPVLCITPDELSRALPHGRGVLVSAYGYLYSGSFNHGIIEGSGGMMWVAPGGGAFVGNSVNASTVCALANPCVQHGASWRHAAARLIAAEGLAILAAPLLQSGDGADNVPSQIYYASSDVLEQQESSKLVNVESNALPAEAEQHLGALLESIFQDRLAVVLFSGSFTRGSPSGYGCYIWPHAGTSALAVAALARETLLLKRFPSAPPKLFRNFIHTDWYEGEVRDSVRNGRGTMVVRRLLTPGGTGTDNNSEDAASSTTCSGFISMRQLLKLLGGASRILLSEVYNGEWRFGRREGFGLQTSIASTVKTGNAAIDAIVEQQEEGGGGGGGSGVESILGPLLAIGATETLYTVPPFDPFEVLADEVVPLRLTSGDCNDDRQQQGDLPVSLLSSFSIPKTTDEITFTCITSTPFIISPLSETYKKSTEQVTQEEETREDIERMGWSFTRAASHCFQSYIGQFDNDERSGFGTLYHSSTCFSSLHTIFALQSLQLQSIVDKWHKTQGSSKALVAAVTAAVTARMNPAARDPPPEPPSAIYTTVLPVPTPHAAPRNIAMVSALVNETLLTYTSIGRRLAPWAKSSPPLPLILADVYRGEFQHNLRHGRGVMVWATGVVRQNMRVSLSISADVGGGTEAAHMASVTFGRNQPNLLASTKRNSSGFSGRQVGKRAVSAAVEHALKTPIVKVTQVGEPAANPATGGSLGRAGAGPTSPFNSSSADAFEGNTIEIYDGNWEEGVQHGTGRVIYIQLNLHTIGNISSNSPRLSQTLSVGLSSPNRSRGQQQQRQMRPSDDPSAFSGQPFTPASRTLETFYSCSLHMYEGGIAHGLRHGFGVSSVSSNNFFLARCVSLGEARAAAAGADSADPNSSYYMLEDSAVCVTPVSTIARLLRPLPSLPIARAGGPPYEGNTSTLSAGGAVFAGFAAIATSAVNNSEQYEGWFANNVRHGHGKLISGMGGEWEGIFSFGVPVTGSAGEGSAPSASPAATTAPSPQSSATDHNGLLDAHEFIRSDDNGNASVLSTSGFNTEGLEDLLGIGGGITNTEAISKWNAPSGGEGAEFHKGLAEESAAPTAFSRPSSKIAADALEEIGRMVMRYSNVLKQLFYFYARLEDDSLDLVTCGHPWSCPSNPLKAISKNTTTDESWFFLAAARWRKTILNDTAVFNIFRDQGGGNLDDKSEKKNVKAVGLPSSEVLANGVSACINLLLNGLVNWRTDHTLGTMHVLQFVRLVSDCNLLPHRNVTLAALVRDVLVAPRGGGARWAAARASMFSLTAGTLFYAEFVRALVRLATLVFPDEPFVTSMRYGTRTPSGPRSTSLFGTPARRFELLVREYLLPLVLRQLPSGETAVATALQQGAPGVVGGSGGDEKIASISRVSSCQLNLKECGIQLGTHRASVPLCPISSPYRCFLQGRISTSFCADLLFGGVSTDKTGAVAEDEYATDPQHVSRQAVQRNAEFARYVRLLKTRLLGCTFLDILAELFISMAQREVSPSDPRVFSAAPARADPRAWRARLIQARAAKRLGTVLMSAAADSCDQGEEKESDSDALYNSAESFSIKDGIGTPPFADFILAMNHLVSCSKTVNVTSSEQQAIDDCRAYALPGIASTASAVVRLRSIVALIQRMGLLFIVPEKAHPGTVRRFYKGGVAELLRIVRSAQTESEAAFNMGSNVDAQDAKGSGGGGVATGGAKSSAGAKPSSKKPVAPKKGKKSPEPTPVSSGPPLPPVFPSEELVAGLLLEGGTSAIAAVSEPPIIFTSIPALLSLLSVHFAKAVTRYNSKSFGAQFDAQNFTTAHVTTTAEAAVMRHPQTQQQINPFFSYENRYIKYSSCTAFDYQTRFMALWGIFDRLRVEEAVACLDARSGGGGSISASYSSVHVPNESGEPGGAVLCVEPVVLYRDCPETALEAARVVSSVMEATRGGSCGPANQRLFNADTAVALVRQPELSAQPHCKDPLVTQSSLVSSEGVVRSSSASSHSGCNSSCTVINPSSLLLSQNPAEAFTSLLPLYISHHCFTDGILVLNMSVLASGLNEPQEDRAGVSKRRSLSVETPLGLARIDFGPGEVAKDKVSYSKEFKENEFFALILGREMVFVEFVDMMISLALQFGALYLTSWPAQPEHNRKVTTDCNTPQHNRTEESIAGGDSEKDAASALEQCDPEWLPKNPDTELTEMYKEAVTREILSNKTWSQEQKGIAAFFYQVLIPLYLKECPPR